MPVSCIVIYCKIHVMTDSRKEIIERSVKQLNTHGNGIGVLVTRKAKAIGLKSGSKVQVSAVRVEKIKKFPSKED